jgi:hypothetical protein
MNTSFSYAVIASNSEAIQGLSTPPLDYRVGFHPPRNDSLNIYMTFP